MLGFISTWQDAEFGAATRRWNFDASDIGCSQQGMCASWK